MKILLLSPYHDGSHKAWAEGLKRWSRNDIELLTLPGRYWKWRMHGGAITLARRTFAKADPDLILATDMLDLTTFLALTRVKTAGIPAVLYMHENQLTYPLPADKTTGPMRRQKGERDLHYSFVNVASLLAADFVLFNSDFHRRSLLDGIPGFLRQFPEYNEIGQVQKINRKSRVLPVGIELANLECARNQNSSIDEPPLILWNQRWEYDKNPLEFLDILSEVAGQGVEFRVAVCGQSFQKQPEQMQEAIKSLGCRVVHQGYLRRELYQKLIWEADITISTAFHEFFGISVIEAAVCETLPFLPDRLSYPELLPAQFHADCLYQDRADLVPRLIEALRTPEHTRHRAKELSQHLKKFDWKVVAADYDEFFESVASRQ